MSRSSERAYPYALPLILAVAFYLRKLPFPEGQDILSASITMGAIFVGFLATTKSIVISLQSPSITHLRSTPFYDLLIKYLSEAIWIALLYCSLSLVGFFYEGHRPPLLFGALWVFFTGGTILTFFRITRILLSLISNLK